eukprot:scaffold43349_cov73-Phaeocystis_antarctica.AAC.2
MYVPEAQGSLPSRRHALYVRRTRTSLGRAVRTMYRGTTGSACLGRARQEAFGNGWKMRPRSTDRMDRSYYLRSE